MENFKKIYKENYNFIFSYILRKIKNEMDAEDMINDVFLKFFNQNCNDGDELKWLMQIAKTKVIDWKRSKKTRLLI